MRTESGTSNRGTEPFDGLIQDVRNSWFRIRVVEGAAAGFAALFAAALIVFVLDNLFALPEGIRLACLILTVLGILGLPALGLKRGLALSPIEAVLLLEQRNKRLDNRMINTLLLRGDPAASDSPFLSPLQKEAEDILEGAALERPCSAAKIKKRALAALIGALFLIAYALILPGPFQNALTRFANPLSDLPALSQYVLRITPGHASIPFGDPLLVLAAPEGRTPVNARIRLEGEEGEQTLPMEFSGGVFLFRVDRVKRDFSYCVLAEDFKSSAYQVSVIKAPKPKMIRVTYNFPSYTGLDPGVQEGSTGDMAALSGTLVKLEVQPDRPASSGRLEFREGNSEPLSLIGEGWLSGSFFLHKTTTYRMILAGPGGFEDPEGPEFEIVVLKDEPPTVEITDPGRDVVAERAADLHIMILARDDVGLEEVTLIMTAPEEKVLAQWSFDPATTRVHAPFLLPLEDSPSSVFYYKALAKDRAGLAAESETFRVTRLPPEADRAEARAVLESLFQRLKRILKHQLEALKTAESLRKELDRGKGRALARKKGSLAKAQSSILNLSLKVLEAWEAKGGIIDGPSIEESGRLKFEALVDGPMPEALEQAKRIRQSESMALGEPLDELAAKQREIASTLRELLNEKRGLLEALRSEVPALEPEALTEDEEKILAAIREAANTLKEFAEDQRRIIETTQDFLQEKGEDYSALDLSRIEELKKSEEEWGEILKSLADDYHKLQPQDFSDSTLSDEFVELYSEIEEAAEALDQKAIEIAVPHEQTGLELAESITANLERWLADKADNIQWSMEDPVEDYDVPLADLPSELEDLVGDLIDSEESMTAEAEDITSGWMDSLNEGAGWSVSDGPISNMSAKGITGNLLPNEHEVGGRSGEGRSGRSHGQMVEKTAQGKGGRQTPTRLTPDPFEAGVVDDESQDPEGGSTGGGKLGGSGPEGLRGPEAPEVQARMDALASRQAEIRQEGEKVKSRLNRYGYHPQDLDRALELMREMEDALTRYERRDYAESARRITGKLKHVETLMGTSRRILRERAEQLPTPIRDALRSAFDEEAPEEYRELISRYYRSLAEDGGK